MARKRSQGKSTSLRFESLTAVTGVLGGLNEALDVANHGLALFNRANELKRERTQKE